MYNICWDKDNTVIMSDGNTTRPDRHLLDKHQIRSNGRMKVDENSETVQTVSIIKSVLQQHIKNV